MKKLIIILGLLIFSMNTTNAIQWKEFQAKNSNAYLDIDSIATKGKYYFYNIYTINQQTEEPIIVTVQSSKNNGFSARINTYDKKTYYALNGDYENITKKETKKLELIEYGSIVSSAFNIVKTIKNSQIEKIIIIEE